LAGIYRLWRKTKERFILAVGWKEKGKKEKAEKSRNKWGIRGRKKLKL